MSTRSTIPSTAQPSGLRTDAWSAAGIAQETLIELLVTDAPLRRFYADLAHRSGAVHRIAIRLEAAAYERSLAREFGFGPALRDYERFLRDLEPWISAEPMTAESIDVEIRGHLAARGLPWDWLGRASFGAFTWVVDTTVTQFWNVPDWKDISLRPERTPLPSEVPELEAWYWNVGDRPRVPEDKVFTGIHLFRGDSLEAAHARIRAYVEEVEQYLAHIEAPTVLLGPRQAKRRESVVRNVSWYYRNVVQGTSKQELAREEFAAGEPNPKIREAIGEARAKDVRDGIERARRLLSQAPYDQPILPLDEYERGRMTI